MQPKQTTRSRQAHGALGQVSLQHKPMQRVSLLAVVQFRGAGTSGSGVLQNISLTGALIAPATTIPALSTPLRLELVTACGIRLSVEAAVSRLQDAGFAVELTSLAPNVERMLRTLVRSRE